MTEITKTSEIAEDSYTSIEYDILHDGLVVGGASIMLDDESAYCEIIGVDEQYRGQGIGGEALDLLSGLYGSIIIAPDNERASHLYARMGREANDTQGMYDMGFGVYVI